MFGGVDLHTHLAPQLPVACAGVERMPDGRLRVDGHEVGPSALYEPARLVEWLRENRLEEAIVSPPPPFFRQHLDEDAAVEWSLALNEGLLQATGAHAQLTALAYLPLDHPRAALATYEHVRTEARFAGVIAGVGRGSALLSHSALHPLWGALNADRRLLFLHPSPSSDDRLERFYLANLLGNPAETALAAAHLVFGDVLARWPLLRVLLAHCGGCVPAVIGRWQHGVDTARPGLQPLTEPPRSAVKRLYVDCITHDRQALDQAASVFGDDRLVIGSDWPFPMGLRDPWASIAHRDEKFMRAVAVTNAGAALGRN